MDPNCKIALTDNLADNFSMNLGDATYFKGAFSHPWFFDTPRKIMVRDYNERYIHFKTIHNEIYQFRLEVFHCKKERLLTSTLGDTFWFFLPQPSIEKTMNRAIKARKRVLSKTSNSGYVCWGQYFDELRDRLIQNLEKEQMLLNPDKLQQIADELKRREELYAV